MKAGTEILMRLSQQALVTAFNFIITVLFDKAPENLQTIADVQKVLIFFIRASKKLCMYSYIKT